MYRILETPPKYLRRTHVCAGCLGSAILTLCITLASAEQYFSSEAISSQHPYLRLHSPATNGRDYPNLVAHPNNSLSLGLQIHIL